MRRGNDDVFANDGNEDVIYCGKEDIVRYDEELHTIEYCEIKNPFL